MVMNCRHVAQLRDRHLDGELSSSLSAEVHAHLLQCSGCRRQFEMFRACGEVIARDRAEPKLSPDFAAKLAARVVTTPRHSSATAFRAFPLQTRRALRERFWRLAMSVSLPAAAAMLFLTVLIWPTSDPTPAGLVAGYNSSRATDVVGMSNMAEPTADAVAEMVRAANSITQLPGMLVDQAREGVPDHAAPQAPNPEITLLNALLFPFNEALDSNPEPEPAKTGDDGVVRF